MRNQVDGHIDFDLIGRKVASVYVEHPIRLKAVSGWIKDNEMEFCLGGNGPLSTEFVAFDVRGDCKSCDEPFFRFAYPLCIPGSSILTLKKKEEGDCFVRVSFQKV